MKRKKILFIFDIDIKTFGPSVHLLNDILNEFKEEKVYIISKTFENDYSFTQDNFKYIFLKSNKPKKTNYISRYLNNKNYIQRVIKYLKQDADKYDNVFIQSSQVAYKLVKYLNKRTNSKIIYNVQDLFPDNLYLKSKLYKLLLVGNAILNKKMYKRVDHIITISEDIKQELTKKGIKRNKISVIYNWSTSNNDNSGKVFFEENKDTFEDKTIFAYAGNIGIFQNVNIILEVAKQIKNPDILFLIVGEGSQKDYLIKKAKEESINNVLFYNKLPISFMSYFYKNVDCNLIVTSPGLYKVALPSKTAFCLEQNNYNLITLEKESTTRKRLSKFKNAYFANPSNINTLVKKINFIYKKLNDKEINSHTRKEYSKVFSKKNNPKKYYETIISV